MRPLHSKTYLPSSFFLVILVWIGAGADAGAGAVAEPEPVEVGAVLLAVAAASAADPAAEVTAAFSPLLSTPLPLSRLRDIVDGWS